MKMGTKLFQLPPPPPMLELFCAAISDKSSADVKSSSAGTSPDNQELKRINTALEQMLTTSKMGMRSKDFHAALAILQQAQTCHEQCSRYGERADAKMQPEFSKLSGLTVLLKLRVGIHSASYALISSQVISKDILDLLQGVVGEANRYLIDGQHNLFLAVNGQNQQKIAYLDPGKGLWRTIHALIPQLLSLVDQLKDLVKVEAVEEEAVADSSSSSDSDSDFDFGLDSDQDKQAAVQRLGLDDIGTLFSTTRDALLQKVTKDEQQEESVSSAIQLWQQVLPVVATKELAGAINALRGDELKLTTSPLVASESKAVINLLQAMQLVMVQQQQINKQKRLSQQLSHHFLELNRRYHNKFILYWWPLIVKLCHWG